MNADRAVFGYGRTFGRRDDDRPEHYRQWLDLGLGASMRWEHNGTQITASGATNGIGTWRRFAIVENGAYPAGLVCLGEVDEGPVGDTLLHWLGEAVSDLWGPPKVGLSLGTEVYLDGRGGVAGRHVFEVSITPSPADAGALVLATGVAAVRGYEALVGEVVGTR